MNCIIDTGGGNRGAFGAGVLERCLNENITFDYSLGVSSGSANIITYLAKQNGRLYRFYHDYAFRKEYMGMDNLLKNGEFINLNYIYSVITNSTGEDPLDFNTVKEYKGLFEISITNANTAESVYVKPSEMVNDDYWALKASCAIPFICKPIIKDGITYFDGGIAEPIPIDRALNKDCDHIVLIISRPKELRKNSAADSSAAYLIKKKYFLLSKALSSRIEKYNASLQKAIELEKEGKCLIIAPDSCCNVGTLKKTPEDIDSLYVKGYNKAKAIKEFLK